MANRASASETGRPIDLSGRAFAQGKYEVYRRLLEGEPVTLGKIGFVKLTLVARYEDCRFVLTDDSFVRNRGRARGNRRTGAMPIPLPRSLAALAGSMIFEDDPEHRRHRNLVNKAFTTHQVARLTPEIESLANGLLDDLEANASFEVDLLDRYARVVPTRVIAGLMGLEPSEIGRFEQGLHVLTNGFSGLGIIRTLLFDLPRMGDFLRTLIERKRREPSDDLLSRLIEVEEEGDRLTEDELLAMAFLLIVAGFETTLHLIGNGVQTLLEHPDELDRLHAEPTLWPSAVEEIVRFAGPVHGTKPQYATRDLEIAGVPIAKGTGVMPLLGAANRDPRAFERADVFDVSRSPNHHLGFGFGAHFCLGRPLALLEAEVALRQLVDRFPKMRIAGSAADLEYVNMPGWHRLKRLPVLLGG